MQLYQRENKIVYLLFICCFIIIYYSACDSTEYKNHEVDLNDLVSSNNLNRNLLTIHIDKSEYKLSILSAGEIIKEYPVVFGGNPKDDKLREGDQCTPEGDFKVQDYYPHNKWQKFIWVDYPTTDSWKKHKAAKANGIISSNARIGGEIGIHGVPSGLGMAVRLKYNWTLGCISMENDDINELYPYVFRGMKIHIQK